MTKKIDLSSKTLSLIAGLKNISSQAEKISETFILEAPEHVELTKLHHWLTQNNTGVLSSDAQLLLASLNAALLKDLAKSLPNYKKKNKQTGKEGWSNKAKYGSYTLLIIAGTVFFGCEGFDGITSIVRILPLSTVALFAIGTVFALISILAFYLFNLTEIAKNLDIEKKEARQLVDNYLKEVEQINTIQRCLNKDYIEKQKQEELEEELELIELLIARYNALDKGREALTKLADNKKLTTTKYLIAGFMGVLYFSGGFFAGQAVATVLAGFFVTSTATVFWPIFIASVAVGLAAFGVYWFVTRPSIDKVVSRWFGLDQEKIDLLCDAEKIENHKSKLENLKINLTLSKDKLTLDCEKTADYKAKIKAAKTKIKELRRLLAQPDEDRSPSFFSVATEASIPIKKSFILRQKTRDLITRLGEFTSETEKLSKFFKSGLSESIKLTKFIKWSNQNNLEVQSTDNQQFLLASLNSALFKDLALTLVDPKPAKKKKDAAANSNLIYSFLAIAGIIYFGCQGFDGITSIVGMFSIPKAAIISIGAVFALLYILAFRALDLTEISKNLGIEEKNVHQLVDIYLKEVEAIKAIRRSLNNQYNKRQSVDDLEDDLLITELLIARYKKLDEGRTLLINLLANKKLTVLKYVISGVVGLIYFSSGFFTGQAVALAIASLFVASTAPLFWPVIVASSAVGLAALAVYWFVERPNIETLVSRLCGLDQEKIERFSNSQNLEKQKEKLEELKTHITTCKTRMVTDSIKYVQYEDKLQTAPKEIEVLTKKLKQELDSTIKKSKSSEDFNVAEEPNSFFSIKRPRSKSLDETSLINLEII